MPAGWEVPEIPVRCWCSLSYSRLFPTFSSRHLGILLSSPPWRPSTPCDSEAHGCRRGAPHGVGGDVGDGGAVDLPGREAPQYLGECHVAFHAGQCSPEAEVGAVAEGHVTIDRAVDVVGVGIRVLAFVASGRAGEKRKFRPFRKDRPVQLDVAGDVAEGAKLALLT